MLSQLLIAWSLMAVCVAIHATGVALAARWLQRSAISTPRLWHWTGLFIVVAAWIILLHLVEITVWGTLYVWQRAMPDLPAGLYSVP